MVKKIKITLGSRAPKGSKSTKSSKSFRAATTKRPQKAPKRPLPQQRRDSTSSLSSAPNLSDEDGYSAVEDVPDSDDDEDEHVFKAEMEHIISLRQQSKSLRQQNARLQPQSSAHSSTRPGHDSDNDDDDGTVENGAADDESEDDMTDDESLAGDNFSPNDDSSVFGSSLLSSAEDAALPEVTPQESLDQPPTRHVRFAGVPDTESEFETDEDDHDHDDIFPDIFVAQSSLDPGFRREIENDADADSDNSDTFWDYAGNNDNVAVFDDVPQQDNSLFSSLPVDQSPNWPFESFDPVDQNANTGINDGPSQQVNSIPLSDDEDGSSEGYESDGETTEEDEPVLIPRRRITPEPPVQGDASPATKGKSPAGRLLVSSRKKPICIVNPHTRKMMIIRPQQRARPMLHGAVPLMDLALNEPPFNATQSSPIKDSTIMWSDSPFDPIWIDQLDLMGNFLPNPSFGLTMPESGEESLNDEDNEENDSEKNFVLNLEEFIDISGLSDDCAADDEEPAGGEGDVEGAETPSRRPSTSIVEHPLYKHLQGTDRVGAFRINQDNQKLISNGVATKESLAFSNPLYHGTLRGIKQGNLQGAATPLTPERRPKRSIAKVHAKSPMEMNQGKRKASEADDHSHKRHRSLTDATQMQF